MTRKQKIESKYSQVYSLRDASHNSRQRFSVPERTLKCSTLNTTLGPNSNSSAQALADLASLGPLHKTSHKHSGISYNYPFHISTSLKSALHNNAQNAWSNVVETLTHSGFVRPPFVWRAYRACSHRTAHGTRRTCPPLWAGSRSPQLFARRIQSSCLGKTRHPETPGEQPQSKLGESSTTSLRE